MAPTAARTATFPQALDPIAERVETRIDLLLTGEQKRWIEVDAALGDPLEALREFVAAGGKRLRPAFCACAFVGAGGQIDDPAVINAAAALELVHTFALVHDDIMDGSEIRRGRDAMHRQFARQHESESWRGPARRFGDGMAILVGDFALVYADIHEALMLDVEGLPLINCGSVGNPLDSTLACYLILEFPDDPGGVSYSAQVVRIPYNRAAEVTAAEASGMPFTREYITELLTGAYQRRRVRGVE